MPTKFRVSSLIPTGLIVDSVRLNLREAEGPSTEMPQARRGSKIDWTSAAKDALLWVPAGGFGYPPARLGLAPRFAGLWVVRASIPTPRTNGAQTHVVPFPREVPEPQERRTQEGERQIERDIPAQGHVRRGRRQDAGEG